MFLNGIKWDGKWNFELLEGKMGDKIIEKLFKHKYEIINGKGYDFEFYYIMAT